MSRLKHHLEQISASATTIAELPFPPPKIFTNALLQPHEITTLIRDTEPHERALFSVDPSRAARTRPTANRRATTARRATAFDPAPSTRDNVGIGGPVANSMASRIYAVKNNQTQSAVAQVLGGDMMNEIKKSTAASGRGLGASGKGEIDVELLLQGADMLCDVYPITGAKEKIATLRHRYNQAVESVMRLEGHVSDQAKQLEQMNLQQDYEHEPMQPDVGISDEDLQRELEAIRELEAKKRRMEERLYGIDRDLDGF